MGITGGEALGAGVGLLGMIGQEHRAGQQHNRQKELMDIQNQNQRALNEQGQQLQMKTWNETNAAAQMEHYKEAGLNPALMYGGSGAGGQTGSQGGGSAAGGNAAAPMDIGNAIQAGLAVAQTKNINADTKKKESEVGGIEALTNLNRKGLEKADAEITLKLKQAGTEEEKQDLIKQQTEVQRLLQGLTGQQTKTEEKRTDLVGAQAGIAQTEDEIKWATKEDQKAIIQEEAKLQGLRGEKTKNEIDEIAENILVKRLKQAEQRAGIKLTNEQREAIWHKTWQGWTNSGFNGLTKIIQGIAQFKPKNKTVVSHKEGVRNGRAYWESVNTTSK